MILTCTCKHEGQDKINGKSRRIHNKTAKDLYRCTVCLTEKGDTGGAKKKKKK